MVWVILYSSRNSFVVRNCIFFHTFEKNILVTVKNWWSLTYGQVYIFWTLIACDVFYLKRYKADRYAFATFHIYIICLKCPLDIFTVKKPQSQQIKISHKSSHQHITTKRWKHVCAHFGNLRLRTYISCAHLEINVCAHVY